jgi:predicted O-methyltransferase YrrM
MNLYPAMAFIRHLLSARSAAGHGVHSPFVFDFLTLVVRGKSDALIIREVDGLRREMLADRRVIRVTDLGAGSVVHKGEERRISEIASTAALPLRQLALLSRIAGSISHGSQRGIILELGTSLGISTLALALAAPERRVVSVEGCPALAEMARENLRRHGAANVEILNMEFSEALSLLRKQGTRVTLAFIDGNHRGEALKQYVSQIRTMGDEMIIVADDIHLNRDMYNTWHSLVGTALQVPTSPNVPSGAEIMPPAHPGIAPATSEKMPLAHPGKPTATIETLRFGLIFCRRSLTPRHYRIRY